MSQISRPMQIALGATVLFLVAWLVFLRPGDEEPETQPATPAQTQPAAPAQTTAATEPAEEEATAPPPVPALSEEDLPETAGGIAIAGARHVNGQVLAERESGATAPGIRVEQLPRDVRRAIEQRRVVVLLFYNRNPRASDDQAVRRAVAALPRHGGRVFVKAVNIKHVGSYSGITGAVRVLHSPTIVIVDRKRAARTLTGFVDTVDIDQAVRDALFSDAQR